MAACRILMYNLMGWSPVFSIAFNTKGYSHSSPVPLFSVIPVICRAARWWNPSRTLSISPFTTQLLLTYKITYSATALYISPWSCTVAPILSITLATIPHSLRSFRRFWYTSAQLLLFWAIVRHRSLQDLEHLPSHHTALADVQYH